VLIDDYHLWDGCSRAVHDYLSGTGSTLRIKTCPAGVTYLQKELRTRVGFERCRTARLTRLSKSRRIAFHSKQGATTETPQKQRPRTL
jgi:hypothetical protein